MQVNDYQDLRVQRTITSIYDAFKQLICEKDYSKITVTELARLARINKKTFYRYYPTLDDLLRELQAQYSKAYLDEIADLRYPRDLAKSVAAFFTYSASQGEAYDRITTCTVGSYVGIRQQMINDVMTKTWGQSPEFNQLADWQKQILLNFVEQTGLKVYTTWVANGRVEPLADVIRAATALMQGGVTQYLNLTK
ncbi:MULTISPECIES: TetR/AcrR family transcriptional regulator [Levilactobacillus]|uniref:TetR family transcriptional regulator n=2 Tax=Levilactobacillus TaxID=2767886 RepID=A0A0F3RTS1_9LACO|nr:MULTISPECIES: TetR/AcrR family transcriptional regulator [Levilactobacillus]KJW13280.1 TetR family transcriptional regulator [Levilactobacillus spicheri]KRL15661.1 transcription regulator [Levilactobacillus zymae DSM 19395]MDT6980602.1 TetR/AcrR family transcriptional regulator [Levilactobacillus zymae]QFR60677.1 TetR family transcriptional regulator [Levilactobacillus zymae]GEO70883.1 TetR family transcriptional regulator [Levilactobacillus zymae]